jgi:3-oxoacyl-[acyl-carrier protein] reductase
MAKKETEENMRKAALITGASRGIGAAIARKFAKAGYDLVLCCRQSETELKQLSEQLIEYGVTVKTYIGDVGDNLFVEQMIAQTIEKFGKIDVLINNAGISYIGLLTDMSIGDWNRIVSTNLTSIFLTCRYAVPSMVSAKSGCIINISSVWGNVGASCEVAYSACKGGVNSFTRALGKELAPSNISVNAIACGMIDTDMNRCFSEEERMDILEGIPAGRMGTPDEVASLALSVAEGPSYLNSQIITLDGGWI